MNQSKKSKTSSFDAGSEEATAKRLGIGDHFCICSIYKDTPGKSGALCEPCRLALAARGEQVADKIAGTSNLDQGEES